MSRIASHWLRSALTAAAFAATAGCADEATLGPDPRVESTVQIAASSNGVVPAALASAPGSAGRPVDLGACDNLRPPTGTKLALRLYAQGVQIYRWNGSSWAFVAPQATLTADAGGHGMLGSHYGGPTWESNNGGYVIGAVLERCTPDANAIQWLLLRAVSSEGPGIFDRVTFIQRVNTVGGIAPSAPGSMTGAEARVPYTTEYLFYRTP